MMRWVPHHKIPVLCTALLYVHVCMCFFGDVWAYVYSVEDALQGW